MLNLLEYFLDCLMMTLRIKNVYNLQWALIFFNFPTFVVAKQQKLNT